MLDCHVRRMHLWIVDYLSTILSEETDPRMEVNVAGAVRYILAIVRGDDDVRVPAVAVGGR